MKCGRCGATENLLIHGRKFYKRTNETRTYYYCRTCQRTRVLEQYRRSRPIRLRVKDEEWKRVAYENNTRIMSRGLRVQKSKVGF